MQSNNQNSEITSKFIKKISPLQDLNRQVRVQNYAHELRDKTFSEKFELLYHLAISVGFLSQALSVWSSYVIVHSIVSIKAMGDIAFALTLVLLLTIEAIKFALVTISFSQVFSLRPTYPYPILAIMLVWSSFSMYLCVSGSTEIAKDKTGAIRLVSEQASKEAELKNAIAQIQNSDSYKDVIWSGGGLSSKVLSSVGRGLIQKRELELDSLRKTYQAKTATFKTEQASAQSKFNYFFGVFELLFLFCTAGAYYYKQQSAIEAKLHEHLANTPPQHSEAVCEPIRTYANQSEVVRTESEVSANHTAKQLEPTANHTAKHSEISEPIVNQNEAIRTENEPETKQSEAQCEAKVRSESANYTELTLPELQSEADFNALIEKFTNGKRAYLEKYKEAVKTILECERRNVQASAIAQICIEKHTIGKTTYFNILRIIRNTK